MTGYKGRIACILGITNNWACGNNFFGTSFAVQCMRCSVSKEESYATLHCSSSTVPI